MATKKTELEIRTNGGTKVESDLKKIGAVGEQTGKKIEKGGKQASKGLRAVDAAVSNTTRSMRRLADQLGPIGAALSKLGPAGLAAAGGAVAAGGLFALTKRAAESANALLDTSRAIGINVEALQEWQFVAEQSGVSADTFSGLMLKLSKRLGDITTIGSGPLVGFLEKFDKGLLESLRSTSDFDQQLSMVVNRLGQLATAAERASFADALFSESGRDVGLVALQGAERIDELRQRLQDLGGVIKEDATENAKQLTDTIGELSVALSGNFNNALLTLAPTIKSFAEDISNLIPPFVDWIESFKDLENRSLGSLAREAAELRAGLDQLANAKTPQFLLSGQIAKTEEQLKAVNAALAERVKIRSKEILQDRERQQVAEELRTEQNLVAAAAKEAAEQEKKRATEAKKTATERKKALADIARLEDKASKAGLGGLALLTLERDKELLKQFDRLQQSLITSQEFADARLAIEKSFNAEKADIAEKAAKDTTKKMAAEAEKQVSVFVSPFSTAVSNIQSSFADTFTDIYRNGETSFEDLSDRIKDIFARLAGEITALMVIRPVIAGISASFAGSAAAGAAGGAAGSGASGSLASGGLGAWLATGAGSNAMAAAIGIGAGLAGNFAGQQFSSLVGMNSNAGGNIGGAIGGIGGAALFGPGGAAIGAFLGNLAGSFIGNGFGFGGGNDKVKFGFGTGADGVQTPFGGLSVTASKNIDSAGIIQGLADLDEAIASLLSPGQIEQVRADLSGTGQFFSVKGFDNESFDVVKTRLIKIIDSVAENTVASGLLNSIGRDPGNIDELVQSAQGIIELINVFQDDGAELNDAQLALAAINEQFDTLADTAEKLGFAITDVETKRQQAITDLTANFNTSIRDQILAIEDPFTLTLENIARAAEERLENARSLGADLVEAERLTALERAQAFDQAFGGANSSITKFLDSLKTTGAGGLSIAEQTANAESQFNSLLGSARTDPTARADLAALLPTLLDLKRDQLGSTSSFFEFTSFLDSTLRNLVDQGDTVSTLQDIGAAITTGDNAIVDALRDEIGSLKVVIGGMVDDMSLLLNAPTAA